MDDKYIVEDFLHFLATHDGVVVTGSGSYSYQELRKALINYHEKTKVVF